MSDPGLHDVVVEELHPIIRCSCILPLHRLLVGILQYVTDRSVLLLIGQVSTQGLSIELSR